MLTNVLLVLLIDPMIATSDTAVCKVALLDGEDPEYLPEDFGEHARCVSFPCPAIPPLSRLAEPLESIGHRKSNGTTESYNNQSGLTRCY